MLSEIAGRPPGGYARKGRVIARLPSLPARWHGMLRSPRRLGVANATAKGEQDLDQHAGQEARVLAVRTIRVVGYRLHTR
jgi:hypothetical protein